MFRHLSRAVAQLPDPAISGRLMASVAITIGLFLLTIAGIWFALYRTAVFQVGWLDTAVDVLGGFAALALAWLLFPAIVVAVSSLFLESVVKAVERRHYPMLPAPRPQPLLEGIVNSVKFLGVVLLLNVLVLPLYLVPVVNAVVFYALNGYLLGREYYELVALRRLDPQRMRYLRSAERLRLFLGGTIIAFLSVVPIVNLLVPVIAAAFMVHLFEELRRGLPPAAPA